MSIKSIIIIALTVLLTVAIMQNTDAVPFTFLFFTFYLPKLVIMTTVSVFAFIMGILVGRPKKVKKDVNDSRQNNSGGDLSDTLSDEDREYIK